MKKFGADLITNDPVRPQGYEGMGGLSRTIPGLNFEAASSHHANHTMEMEVDALTDVGHTGFLVDAQAIPHCSMTMQPVRSIETSLRENSML
jgi:hypothetical protein